QKDILDRVIALCRTEFKFANFNEVMDYFKKMINIMKQMNYSVYQSEEYHSYDKQLDMLVKERKIA
ncbi:MAG: V-type ATP synthase subunit A, partial [Bacteroidales bacterium]|nr:V-type ATP synthase subunit A [Bacteroidales bacterium]